MKAPTPLQEAIKRGDPSDAIFAQLGCPGPCPQSFREVLRATHEVAYQFGLMRTALQNLKEDLPPENHCRIPELVLACLGVASAGGHLWAEDENEE